MKQFFKFTFASCLGSLLALGLLVFILISVIGSVVSSVSKPEAEVDENSVLVINMDKPIYDREVESVQNLLSSDGFMESNIGLTEFIAVINKAKTDKKIKAILLNLSVLQTNGMATAQEIRETLEDFKKSGKKIYAYSDICDEKSYYIASVADKIMVNPAGEIMLSGMGAEVMYLKDLISKFDIDVELIRPKNNAYKSAGEMYINNKMSDSNRVQTRQYLSSVWDVISSQIAASRGINIDTFNSLVSSLDAFFPSDAKKNGIIDYVGFKSDFKDLISENLVSQYKLSKSGKVKFISYPAYRKTFASLEKTDKENNIAVVYAYGNVSQGKGSDLSIGAETTCKAIEKARKNKKVKAIVLRVNSPGGDAIASELITNEIIKAKKVKPVIVSMGDYAASAGYEMSSNASYIVANQTTLTGSIGVFGVLPNFSRALKTNLGITFDTVKTHPNSNPLSVTTPMTDQAKALMQRNVEQFYLNFVAKVAQGRGKTPEYINSIAKGRVWTGKDAQRLGLVDEFGGLSKAIAVAAQKAGLKNYGVISYPKTKGIFEQIISSETQELRMKSFTKDLGKPYAFFLQLKDIADMQGVQMRMDYILSF
ncbi:MAG: signal peptide peptidase SppA [Bacteroidales bacterium]|nr:signal peptide peptidase SppA [Bacteroidales bacterium]